MQLRPTSSLWISALLYWALIALSTSTVVAQETDNTGASTSQPHIAVVLPLQSASFGKHANSVRLGILAAAALPQEDGLGVTVYATTEDADQILTAYQRAVSRGARAVIGPLTRSGVTALALSGVVNVPTLALNIPDGDILMPRDLYAFGLQIEAEARQVAQFAHSHGGHRVFVVAGETALGGRIAQAFADEWKKRKGEVAGQFVYSTEGAALARLREQVTTSKADVIFLSLDAARARFIRSYLGSILPIYATSLVFASGTDTLANFDLEGVRFLDMPWLLQPDHPAVMSYLRPEAKRWALDQERFYALGIDAYRIVHELLRPYEPMVSLDGVTGTITPGDAQQFTRSLVPAQFSQGSAKPLDAPLTR
ncbi:MAG TPA: penicillin-binding protein activator [Burkholderiales bacterium]|nr:penicillin-binding protein activator [Burkholderiales bacterium]